MLLEPPGRPPRRGLIVAAVLACAVMAYSGAIRGPFVWDDRMLIERAPRALDSAPLSTVFTEPFWARSAAQEADDVYYRPLTALTYVLDWRLSGGDPALFHVVNLAWHLAVTSLVLALALRAGASPLAAGLGAALFALAPRLTESVAWISGRTDVLAGFFALAVLALHRDGPAAAWRRVAGAAALLAGMLCKEVALAALPAIAAGALVRARERNRPAREVWKDFVPAGCALAAYAALRLFALHGITRRPESLRVQRVPTAFEALGRYAAMLVDPLRPRLQIGELGRLEPWAIAVGVAVAAALAGASLAAVRRRWPAPVVEALVLAAAAIAMVLHLVPFRVNVVAADRFLYVPLAGLAIAGAAAATRLGARSRRAMAFGAGALAAASLAATYHRAATWADEERLWREAVVTTPDTNLLPLNELGNVLFRASRHEEAIDVFRRVLEHADAVQRATALANIAAALSELGRLDEARETFLVVVRSDPATPLNWYNLALIELRRLDFAAGERDLGRALELFPDYAEAEALRRELPALRAAAEALPPESPADPPEVRARRAALYARLGRDRDASRLHVAVLEDPAAAPAAALAAARYLAVHARPELARQALAQALAHGAPPADVETLRQVLAVRAARGGGDRL